jgi:hypothetical protein
MLVAALVTSLALQAREVALGNPLGSSLVSLDASAFVVFVTAAAAVNALRSRVAGVLLVREPGWARLLWLGVLTATMGAVLSVADPRAGTLPLVCHVSVLLWMPLAVCAAGGEAVGLTTVFGLFIAHMVSPRIGPAPWWSPILRQTGSGLDLVAAGLCLAVTCWIYVASPRRPFNSPAGPARLPARSRQLTRFLVRAHRRAN